VETFVLGSGPQVFFDLGLPFAGGTHQFANLDGLMVGVGRSARHCVFIAVNKGVQSLVGLSGEVALEKLEPCVAL